MSDAEDDLLGLLEGDDDVPVQSTSVKRAASPRRDAPAKKRRRARAGSESDMDMSDVSSDFGSPAPRRAAAPKKTVDFDDDDDDDDDVEIVTPESLYPYRNLYKSREEYKELQELNELDREDILGRRQEEIQALKDKQNLRQMLANRDAPVEGGRGERKKTQTGRTDAKASALEKLRKTRKSKAARAADNDDDEYGAPVRRSKARDYSDDDYTSEEDVQTGSRKGRTSRFEVERVEQEDLHRLTLPRWRFARTWTMPWFEEFIKGAWVRVVYGVDPKDPSKKLYNWSEIVGLGEPSPVPYMVETEVTDVVLRLRLGKSERLFTLDYLSDEPQAQPLEYTNLINQLEKDGLSLPTKRDYESKKAVIDKYKNATMTEADLSYSLKKKNELKKRYGPLRIRRAELEGALLNARLAKKDDVIKSTSAELEGVNAQIREMKIAAAAAQAAEANGTASSATATPAATPAKVETPRDALAAVNERNRLANRQAVRRAEIAGRSAAAKAGVDGNVALDPSARVKTTVRLLHDVSAGVSRNASRAASPTPADASPSKQVQTNGATAAGPGVRLEQAIASKVEVDLGDF